MIFSDYFIYVERTETGVTSSEFFYDYKPDKICVITGNNFSGKDKLISGFYVDFDDIGFLDPKFTNIKDYDISTVKCVFPYFNKDFFTMEKLYETLQTIAIFDKDIEPDRNVFIEYPENNLYPSEQSALINLICEKAEKRNGIILIPTNSDYIINGILRNVKNGVIKNTDVDILYVGSPEELGICVEEENKSKTVIGKCLIKENGRIKAFDGFFNQYNKDMNSLL